MASSNEDRIKDLLEDLDLQKLIYDDLVINRPDDAEGIAEALDSINRVASEVAGLLGETAPTSPSPRRDGPSNTPHPLPSEPLRQKSYTPTAPAEPLWASGFGSHWPSYGPSPFAAQPSQNSPPSGLSVFSPMSSEVSRKRPRQDSMTSFAPPQSSKRAAMSLSRSRIAEIEAKLAAQLEESRELFSNMKDPTNVRFTAMADGISEMEKDEEFARMLQAQDDPEEEDREPYPQPTFNFPDRTLGDRLMNPFAPRYENPFSPARPNFVDLDDDIQEIDARSFHSRFGDEAMRQIFEKRHGNFQPGNGLMPSEYPSPWGGRPLPWIRGQHPEMKAFDLIREQQDLEEDGINFE